MKTRVLSALVVAMAISAFASAADFKVIVNNANGVSRIARDDMNAIFLKKTAKWADGTPVVPVNQSKKSPVRESFTTAVHRKSVAAIESYWQQQIFSGRDVPPLEKRSDAEVLAFVRSTPGAIGYVSEAAAVDGVRVVPVN